MKRLTTFVVVCITVVLAFWSYAGADTVEVLIKGLKDPSPEIRVKAIQDLCAG